MSAKFNKHIHRSAAKRDEIGDAKMDKALKKILEKIRV